VPDYEAVQTICLEAERLGYDALYLPDGVHWTDFECWITLTRLATFTHSIRLGPAATFVTYRYPSLLAKIATTFDVLSGGRLDMRLGAGCASAKIDQMHSGIPQPDPETRVEMLDEGLRLIRRLWIEQSVSFQGRFFAAEDAQCWPKPLQRLYPPVTVCANSRRMLQIAAEQADIWEASGGLDDYRRKNEVFRNYCQTVDRDHNTVCKSLEVTVAVADSDKAAEAMAKRHKLRLGVTLGSEYDPLENAIVGRPSHCVEAFSKFVKANISSFTIFFIGVKDLTPLQLFADNVIPAVKNQAD
jgi:alkanesulfonate monooxygenase SsuD/methylene tetrahydromethanopterin reductase-like flavin-dependent oxidoreductase (luciferase family)